MVTDYDSDRVLPDWLPSSGPDDVLYYVTEFGWTNGSKRQFAVRRTQEEAISVGEGLLDQGKLVATVIAVHTPESAAAWRNAGGNFSFTPGNGRVVHWEKIHSWTDDARFHKIVSERADAARAAKGDNPEWGSW